MLTSFPSTTSIQSDSLESNGLSTQTSGLLDPADLFHHGDNLDVLLQIASVCDLDNTEELGMIGDEAKHTFPKATDEEIITLIKQSLEVLEQVKKLRVKLDTETTKHKKIITGIVSEPLGILERQYNMALDILLCQRENMKNLDVIKEKYSDLGIYQIVISDTQKICLNMFTHCLNLNSKVLIKDLRKVIEKLLERPSRRRLGELQIIMSKLETVCECLPFAATCDSRDLFALGQDDPYWEQLNKYVNIETLGPSAEVRKSYRKFTKQLTTSVSMFSRANKKAGFMKTFMLGVGGLYDFFASDQAQRRANLFYSKPDQKTAFQIWNLLDEKSIYSVFKVSFATVEHSKRIYIPRQYASLTFEVIKNALDNRTLNTAHEITLQRADLVEVFKPYKTDFPSYRELRKVNKENIPVRIISTKPLPITKMGFIRDNLSTDLKPHESYLGKFKKMMSHITHHGTHSLKKTPVDSYFDGVILHIHGGGFVAMSSASHQAYTRQWAQIVQKPVLSVDYRLAPENPYPAGLEDCWQAYNWILNNMRATIGIKPSKVVLVGDSAGGNLALGVTLLAIKNGIRVPDGLLLAYPALKLEPNSYSPSLLLSLDDQIIPHSVLKMIAKVYIPPEGNPHKDPLLSPSNASASLLEKLPPVRIMVGDRDPFHDECWRFTDKLRKLNKDVSMTVYRDMPHGFLGFDMPGGMSEAKRCVKDGANFLIELMSDKSKEDKPKEDGRNI